MLTDQELSNHEINNHDFQLFAFNILTNNPIEIQENFVVKFTKENGKFDKSFCKVLHFSVEWDFEELIAIAERLDSKNYPNLFIFVVEVNSFDYVKALSTKVDVLKKLLSIFGSNRPIILQLTSTSSYSSKFYFKEEMSKDFIQQQNNDSTTFLSTLVDAIPDTFVPDMLTKLSNTKYSSLVLRFLRTLNLSDEFFALMILEIAKKGSKSEFLAALDAPFESNGRVLSTEVQKYLETVFTIGEEEANDPNQDCMKRISIFEPKDELTAANNSFCEADSDSSILLAATENKNCEVIDYLITYWTHLIQQLPFDHQVRISTAAFETNQFDILCDLLEISDFPFPENFALNSTNHSKLLKKAEKRFELKRDIENENVLKIDDFIDKNAGLKIAYIPTNKSAMRHALDSKKFFIYFYLKSIGFKAAELDNPEDILTEDEQAEANKYAALQRKNNVRRALSDSRISVHLLFTRSFIHNRKIGKEQEVEYRKKIKKWLEDISNIKFGIDFLDVAASCENLKIIFDFESENVENASLTGQNASGSTYSQSKWIFIGAKLSDKENEQRIKGVLAHELCHYVMRLVYENQENPYYKHMIKIAEMFNEIVKILDKWSQTRESTDPDDECNGTISSVFTAYSSQDFHPELIVRVIQILLEFDDDVKKIEYLENKYKPLFDFWYNVVIPELQKYNLKDRSLVRKANKMFEILPGIKNEKFKLLNTKNIKELFEKSCSVVTTNFVELMMNSIYKYLQNEYGDQLDTQNVFVDPNKLKNYNIMERFNEMLIQNHVINIIVDYTKETPVNFSQLTFGKDTRLIFIIPMESKVEELTKNIEICYKSVNKMEINFSWSDLAETTQQHLLQTIVNFQNNLTFSFGDLIRMKINTIHPFTRNSCREREKEVLNDIVDTQLLTMLLTKSEISINIRPEDDNDFELLFQPRKVGKKNTNRRVSCSFREQSDIELRNNKYVLISDMAGNGKSWTMKNYEKIWLEKNPHRWVNFVDLKQFIDEFKSQATKKANAEFSSFFVDNILKPKTEFEGKLFKNFYKNGNVCILFDGFDEIAPNYADFVSQLAQSFESNGGNQLWIATRDYFEVNLQQQLQLESIYKLSRFVKENGIDLIASKWILNDLRDQIKFESRNKFEVFKRNSPDFEKYKLLANEIIQRLLISEKEPIGWPQFYKMIADIFKDNKEEALDLTRSKIYEKFAKNLYERWSMEKGIIRYEASVESQNKEMSFRKFHQYQAIASLYPDLAKILFPGYDGSEWLEEEIIACGIISKIGGKYMFLHETFREFSVADFVAKELKKIKNPKKRSKFFSKFDFLKMKKNNGVTELFSKILIHRELGIIRMFINDEVDESILLKVLPKMLKLIENFYEMDSLGEIFSKNLEKLADFVIAVLKTGNYKNVNKLIKTNINSIVFNTENSKMFMKFQDFMFEFLDVNDLKKLIQKHEIFNIIIQSNLEIEVFDNFVTSVENKIGSDFVLKEMKQVNVRRIQEKFFSILSRSPKFDTSKLQKCLEIMKKFLKVPEIIKMLEMCQKEGDNIIHTCIRRHDEKYLKVLWTEIENFFKSQNMMDEFEKLITHKDGYNKNILCWAAECKKLEFHQTLWELLIKTFENREELKWFITQDVHGNNFVHRLIARNNPQIIEFTINVIKENFDNIQLKEIVKSTNKDGQNLLQAVAYSTAEIQVHQVIWKNLSNSCQYDSEFLEIIKLVDSNNQNVFNIAATYSTSEIFEFMIEKLEKVASTYEIKNLLSHCGNLNQNLLQSAIYKKSLKMQSTLWAIFRKYFTAPEILSFIEHADNKGENLLFYAFFTFSIEVVELTWNEIKSFMNSDKQIEYLRTTDGHGISLLQWSWKNRSHHKDLYDWIKNVTEEYDK